MSHNWKGKVYLVGIIVKFIIRNIWEKKLRTFLILFSITLSSGLFFASQAITDNVINMFIADAKQFFGSTDIMVHIDSHSPQNFIPDADTSIFAAKTEYMVGTLQASAYFSPSKDENIPVSLRGTTMKDAAVMCPFYTEDEKAIGEFTGRKVIIGKNTADKYGLKAGDNINLEISNRKYRFSICAIAHADGFFTEKGETSNMIVPKQTLSALFGKRNLTNFIFIKLKDDVDLQQSIVELKEIYNRYAVDEPIPMEDLRSSLESMSVGFMMMSVVVAFMSIFIIYTSFKVITLERLPMIGTFRSIGATRRTTDLVLLGESVAYGIIGGAAGCLLGLGALYLITALITPSYMTGYAIFLNYKPAQMISAFAVAVVISLVSSILPIKKVSKIPVKDIVLNSIEKKKKGNKGRYIAGAIFLIIHFVLPPLSPDELAYILDTVSLLSSVIGIILLLPAITSGFVFLFEKLYSMLFGNVGAIAAKNLRQNKSILNNISLLTIAISSLIMISTISDSVLYEVSSFYTRNTDFEIYMSDDNADRTFEQSLLSVDGVEQVCRNYTQYGIEIVGHDYTLGSMYGINTARFPEFFDLELVDTSDPKALLDTLNNERSMIMASKLRDKLGMKVGDHFTLLLNDKEVKYKIIGFQNTLLDNGSNVLVSEKYFKMDTGISNCNEIFIKTSKDPQSVVDAIKKKYTRRDQYVDTIANMEAENYEVNSGIFSAMKAFAYLTLIIGMFGIINNYIVSFIERRRSLAMYRSVGMSRKQIIAMMIAESITGGLIGGITGVSAGLMMTYTMPYVMKALDFPMPILLKPSTLIISFVLGAVITLVASVSPTLKTTRLNLIEALKYE